jgi:outer membrane protein assembly factor BamB/ribosomal protein S27AE
VYNAGRMAQLREIKCPKCSAPVALADDVDTVTCRYCGGTSVVDRSGRAQPQPTVVRPTGSAGSAVAAPLIAGLVLSVGGLVAAWLMVGQSLPSSVSGPGVASVLGAGSEERFADRPMLADVDGDGALDIVGKGWGDGDARFISAFAGRDGRRLWRSEPLTKDADDAAAMRAVVHGRVLSIDKLGKVQAYALATGTPAWSALLGEQARRVCAGDGVIVVETADEARHGLDPTTGKKRELARDAACAAVSSSDSDEAPGYTIVGWSEFRARGLPELHATAGISAHRALVPAGPGPRFLLGARDKGTQVARVAAVDKKKVLWIDDVPGVDPLTTRVNVTTQQAGYAAGRLVIPYDLADHQAGTRMACFDVATGKRVWDVQVHTGNQVSFGLSVSDDSVFYATWGAVHVLSLATGELRYTLGRE